MKRKKSTQHNFYEIVGNEMSFHVIGAHVFDILLCAMASAIKGGVALSGPTATTTTATKKNQRIKTKLLPVNILK